MKRTLRWLLPTLGILALLVAGLAVLVMDPEHVVMTQSIWTRLLFLLVIITEVIIAPIPGGLIAFLAAATWGFWATWPLHYVGNVIGGVIVFLLAKKLGRPFVEKHSNAKKRARIEGWLSSHKHLLWFVYAIPVFPIDTVSIVLGLTDLSLQRFLLIALTALPFYTMIISLLGSKYGHFIPYLEYFSFAVFGAFMLALGYGFAQLRKK